MPSSTGTHQAAHVRKIIAAAEPWRLPAPVSRTTAVADGEQVLLLGGLGPGDVSTSAVTAVAPANGRARQVGALAVAVHDAAGAALGGDVFVFGGGAASTVGSVQRWRPDAPRVVATLPEPRSDLAAATVGHVAYILGGFTGGALAATILRTRNGTTFGLAGKLAQPVRYPAVTVTAGQVWVIGGLLGSTDSNAGAQTSDIQRFDPISGRTLVVGRLPVPLAHAAAFALRGQLYVAGGKVDGQPQTAIYRIDPHSGAVSIAGQLPSPRADAAVYDAGGQAWLFGGELTQPTAPLDTVVRLTVSR